MGRDWAEILSVLDQECDLMARLVLVLQRERGGLAESDLAVLRESAGVKESLVPELGQLQKRRRDLAAEAMGREARPTLLQLLRSAPQEAAAELRRLLRKVADLGEQVFMLNRGNGQMLVQGRDVLNDRLDTLRYRGGRVTLYGRNGAVSIGGASVIERNL